MALRPNRPNSRANSLAAHKAAQDEVFLREVDDALRQDEMLHIAKRHGLWIAAVVIAALLALAGYLWWRSSQQSEAGKQGEQFTLALDQVEAGNLGAARAKLQPLASENAPGPRSLVQLMQGGIALEQKHPDEAAKLFAKVAADGDAPKPFRDLAIVRGVAAQFDTMPPAEVIVRLKPLAVPGNPWFGNAGELLGMAYLKQGNDKLAGPLFAAIARDNGAPETVRARARQLAGLLGVDAIDDVAKAASGDAAAPLAPPQS